MNDNLGYTEYNEEKNRIPWGRVFLTLLSFVIAFFIVILILKACGKTPLRNDLLESGKEYYEKYPSELPTEIGECLTVTLAQLTEEGLINDTKYQTCDNEETYVRVCYLESKTYHYSAILSCEVEDTNYGVWKDGTEDDINEDSDIRFKYLGEEKNSGTKYYYPNNLTDVESVKEYYASVPKNNYTGKEDEQIGYKWYVEKEQKSYWNNGEYSSTQPSGYTIKGEGKTVTKLSETKPSTASYRVIKDVTLYKSQSVARPYIYYCVNPNNPNDVVITDNGCSGTHSKTKNIEFTCDGKTSVTVTAEQISSRNFPACGEWSEWTTTECKNSLVNGIKCETKEGYYYTDTMWKWYKNITVKSYYPSGSANASSEETYYVNSPVSGAIKDTTTQATVNKYYKLEKTNDEINFEEWLQITNGYVDYEELIQAFKEKKYEIESLGDINKSNDIRYQIQLQYRDIEE